MMHSELAGGRRKPMNQDLSNSDAQGATPQKKKDRILRLISLLKLFEGFLILATAFGVLKLLHHDVTDVATDWIAAICPIPVVVSLRRTPTRLMFGEICLSSSSHFQPKRDSAFMKPVALRAGRASRAI